MQPLEQQANIVLIPRTCSGKLQGVKKTEVLGLSHSPTLEKHFNTIFGFLVCVFGGGRCHKMPHWRKNRGRMQFLKCVL
jgi:hypothetical protein